LEDPFNGMTPAKRDELEYDSLLRSLTASHIFCPKCGHRNIFKLSNTGTQLVYFCKRCSAKLNAYWDSYQNGEIAIAYCKVCLQVTFEELKYCISCGMQREAVAVKRSQEISSKIGAKELLDEETKDALRYFGRHGSCNPLYDLIFSRIFKKFPKICWCLCAAILTFFIVLLIVFSFTLWR